MNFKSHVSQFLAPWMIFLFAFILRICHAETMAKLDWYFQILLSDSFVYVGRALDMLSGEFWGEYVFYQDPLYPIFLSAVFMVNGVNLWDVVLIQIFFSSLSCTALFYVSRRFFGNGPAWGTAILACVYPVWIYYDALILKTSFLLSFVSFYMYALFGVDWERQKKWIYLSTIFLAVLCTLGGIFLIWVPIHCWWLWKKRKLCTASINVFIFFLCLTPFTIYNYWVSGDFILLTSQAGQNFYTGNNPQNTTGYYQPLSFVRPSALYEEKDFHAEAERQTMCILKPSEVSRFWFLKGLEHFEKNPALFLTILWKKWVIFFDGYEIPDNYDYQAIRNFSWIRVEAFLSFPFLFALMLWGTLVPVRLKKNPEENWLWLWIVSYSASVILFFIYSRYRAPILPFCMVLAGKPVYDGLQALWYKEWKRAGVFVLGVTLLTMFLNSNPYRMKVDANLMLHYVEKRITNITKTPLQQNLWFISGSDKFLSV